jgi:hypothetical protein
MNAFDHMVITLSTNAYKDDDFTSISKEEYDIFCKEYIFEKLKVGRSFDEQEYLNDCILKFKSK